MKKELSLAIPKSKLQPPPKKSEIIDALTRLKITQFTNEQKSLVEERKKLESEVDSELVKYAKSNFDSTPKNVRVGYCYGKGSSLNGVEVRLEFRQDDLSANLITKLRRIHQLPERMPMIDEKKVRREVSGRINDLAPREERVDALIDDEASRTALEKMLEAIS